MEKTCDRSAYGFHSNCSTYTAFANAKPKLRHRLRICGIPEVPDEFVLVMKLLDKNAKMFIPDSCLQPEKAIKIIDKHADEGDALLSSHYNASSR